MPVVTTPSSPRRSRAGAGRALHREVVGLAPAAGEDDLVGVGAEHAGDDLPCHFERRLRDARRAVGPDGLPGDSARNGSIAAIASGRIGVDAA